MSSIAWRKMAQIVYVFRQIYRICMPFTVILKYGHTYKILPYDVNLCKHIILVEQIHRDDNNISFEILMVKQMTLNKISIKKIHNAPKIPTAHLILKQQNGL